MIYRPELSCRASLTSAQPLQYVESRDRAAPMGTAADFAEYNIHVERVVRYGE